MQNNHRSKVGAALAVAAVALAEWVPPSGVAGPADWFDYGVPQVDDVLRFMLVAGDGAYGEGPYYYRYTAMNLLPYARVWERHLGAGDSTEAGGIGPCRRPPASPSSPAPSAGCSTRPCPTAAWRPSTTATPAGRTTSGCCRRSCPTPPPTTGAGPNAPQPFDTDGAVDLGADAIVAYDDAVTPARPEWSPTQFYVEGGTATFRSGWERRRGDGAGAGRARHRLGVRPRPGRRPPGPSRTSTPTPARSCSTPSGSAWRSTPATSRSAPTGRSTSRAPQHRARRRRRARPTTWRRRSAGWPGRRTGRRPRAVDDRRTSTGPGSTPPPSPPTTATPTLDRRFLFPDDRYLVVADAVAGDAGSPTAPHELTWMMHGNGGGTSGGTFTAQPTGGRWEVGGARLDSRGRGIVRRRRP